MFFELEISYAVNEVNKRYELRKFLRIYGKVKLKSVYNFTSKFKAEQFINFVFSILNVNAKRRRSKPSILILDWTDISLDLNPFRKRDIENKPYKLFDKGILSGHEDDDFDRLQNPNTFILPRLSS